MKSEKNYPFKKFDSSRMVKRDTNTNYELT